MRGEYLPMASFFAWVLELPPHARRILSNRVSEASECGTTSACAENTFRDFDLLDPVGNYLRMRGEYFSGF